MLPGTARTDAVSVSVISLIARAPGKGLKDHMDDSRLDLARRLMVDFATASGITGDRPPRRYLWTDAHAVCNYLALADATGEAAFRQLAGYIFGDNEPQEKMAMTAPVESRETQRGERMKMTAPVLSESRADQGDVYTYAFVMERKYTLDTLPKPLNSDIRIVQRPSRIVAAHRYSGRWTEDNYREHEKRLLDALAADGVEIVGKPLLARYDAPFTPWFLRRNEIQVEVAWESGQKDQS